MTQVNLAETLHLLALEGDYKQVTLATELDLVGFEPKRDDCHGNAKRWVELHPQHRVVPGFLVINNNLFQKHSVVDADSVLLDVTPRNPNESRELLRFIEFNPRFLDIDFDEMVAQVFWPEP